MNILKLKALVLLLLITHISCESYTGASSAFHPVELICEYEHNPLGIDNENPRFSWKIVSQKKNQKQTAYEIIVSSSLNTIQKNRGDVWDTGKINSSQSIHIPYDGNMLQSYTRYYWRVRTYDKDGKRSAWSDVNWFETAVMPSDEWEAAWIGDGKELPTRDEDFYTDDPMPLLRKSFDITKQLLTARLYISGLGYYEAYLNGHRIGNQMLDPGWTSYQERVLYAVYDVTDYLSEGLNMAGIMLGNGWYNPLPLRFWGAVNMREALFTGRPSVKGMIRLEFQDGSSEIIPTDASWETAPGPVIRNNVYLGEYYDARLEIPDWNIAGTSSEGWEPAAVMPAPPGVMSAQRQPPIRVTQTLKPVKIYESQPGVFIADMGQNFAGVAGIRVNGPKDTKITLRYGEDLHADGSLNVLTTVAGQIKGGQGGPGAPEIAWQEDNYVLSGEGTEEWFPRFTFHGFRYVEITGWPGIPEPEDISGLKMNADLRDGGHFASSNSMFNKLDTVINHTFLSNVFSVISDCPAREKLAYGGDILCTTDAFMFHFYMPTFYQKIIRDFTDAQRPLGGIPETVPFVGIADGSPGDKSGPLGFQLGLVHLIRKMYDFYGDTQIITENYDAVRKQIEFLKASTDDYLFDTDLGDHESLDEKSIPLTASVFYYLHVCYMKEFATIIGKQDDVVKYTTLSENIKEAINRKFSVADTGVYARGTQSDQSFALWSNIVGGKDRDKALDVLFTALENKNWHLSTGIFGTKMLFDLLREEEQSEMAYKIANQRDFPGWGHMIENGATTLWETWRYSDNVYSQNHPMFGSVGAWFYRSLLGINELEPGFRKILIKPQPAGDLTSAEGSYETLYGEIGTAWKIAEGKFFLKIKIPVNTTATVMIPSRFGKNIKVDEEPIRTNEEILSFGVREDHTIIEVGSGEYHLEASPN